MVTRAHNNRARTDKLVHTEYQPLEGKQPPVHFGERTGFQAVITSPWVMRWAAIPATYATYRTIRKNATVALARELAVAPILAAEWTVERSKDAPEEWKTCIEDTFMPLRDEYLATALYYGDIDFGYQCWEKIIEPRDGYLKITRLKQLLHDITEICIGHKGGFIGVRQLGKDLGLANSIHVGFRVEGSYLYGIPLLENVRQIYNWWTDCNEGARRYDRKIAGCHIVVEYPDGTCTNRQGKEVECAVMAAEILDTLESAGGVSVPRDMAAYMQVLNTDNPGWKIWILDAGGNQQTSFAARLEYLDKQFCRGIHIPERAMMEGRHGTLAEAEAHGDVIFTIQDIKHRRVTDELNRQAVNQVLYLNYGRKAVGKVRLKASPIADQKKQYFADLYKALLGSPAGAQELGSLDLASIRDQLGLPTVAQDQGDLDQQGQPNLQAVPGVSAGVPGGPGKRLMAQGPVGRPVTVDGQSPNPAAELANAISGMREAVALSSTALKKAEAAELRAAIEQAAFSGGTLGDVLGARGLAEQAEDINGVHALPDDRNASDWLQGRAVAGRTVEVAHSVAAANGGGEPLGMAATDPVDQPPWESEWADDPHSQLTKDIPLGDESGGTPGRDFVHFSAYRLYRPEVQNESVRQEYGLGHPVSVSFGRGPEQNMDITGEGKAGRIISHAAQALRELFTEHRPLSVHFTGTTPSHIRAYHHMLGRLAGEEAGREYKFLRKPGFGGGFHIVHRAAADAPFYRNMREIQPRRVRQLQPAGAEFANQSRGLPPGMLELGPSADREFDRERIPNVAGVAAGYRGRRGWRWSRDPNLPDPPIRDSDSGTLSFEEQEEFLRVAEALRAKLAAKRMERERQGLALDDEPRGREPSPARCILRQLRLRKALRRNSPGYRILRDLRRRGGVGMDNEGTAGPADPETGLTPHQTLDVHKVASIMEQNGGRIVQGDIGRKTNWTSQQPHVPGEHKTRLHEAVASAQRAGAIQGSKTAKGYTAYGPGPTYEHYRQPMANAPRSRQAVKSFGVTWPEENQTESGKQFIRESGIKHAPYIRQLVSIIQENKGAANTGDIAKKRGWHKNKAQDAELMRKGVNRRDEIIAEAMKHGVIEKPEGSARYVAGPNYIHFLEKGEQPVGGRVERVGGAGRPGINVVPMEDPETLGEIHPDYPYYFGKLANSVQNLIDKKIPVTRNALNHRRHAWSDKGSPHKTLLDPNSGYPNRFQEILENAQKRGVIQYNTAKGEFEPGPTWPEYAGTVVAGKGGTGVRMTKEEKRALRMRRTHQILDDLKLEHDSGWGGEHRNSFLNEDVYRVRKTLPPMPKLLDFGRSDSRDVTDMLRVLRALESHGRVMSTGELRRRLVKVDKNNSWLREPRDDNSEAQTHFGDIVDKLLKAGVVQPVTRKSATANVQVLVPRPGESYNYLRAVMAGVSKRKADARAEAERQAAARAHRAEQPQLTKAERDQARVAEIGQEATQNLLPLLQKRIAEIDDPEERGLAAEIANGDIGKTIAERLAARGIGPAEQVKRMSKIASHLWENLALEYNREEHGPLHAWLPAAINEADKAAARVDLQGKDWRERNYVDTFGPTGNPDDFVDTSRRVKRNPRKTKRLNKHEVDD